MAMNTQSTVFDNASAEGTTSDRILQNALAAWRQGNFVEVVDQFNDQFTFTDHALGLEFKDKGRLTEFLVKTRERFPDAERKDNTLFSGGDRVVSEWTLTATQTEPFLGGRLRKVPICVRGISVAQIKNGKISEWSDHYDQLKSRRYGVVDWFTEWIKLWPQLVRKVHLIHKALAERDTELRVINTDGHAAYPPQSLNQSPKRY
jgi:steroid delta-isomerase-like uncharacterized protein